MAKLQSSFLNMFLSLGIICVISGGILAQMNDLTRQPIEASKKANLENALQAVLPAFDNSPVEEAFWAPVSAGDSLKIYPALQKGERVGAAVESNSMKGFSGEIKIIVGLDASGKLLNYKVLEHSETPGLGAKMDEWFRTGKNRQSVIGSDLSHTTLKVTKDNGAIDAITGATISSRAFLDAVNRAYAAFSGNVSDAASGASDAASGASQSSHSKKGGQQ
jgi:electron transport complex protein RnfG